MAIPKYDEITRPLLDLMKDGKEHHLRDLSIEVADHFKLTEEERTALLPSGQTNYVRNRTGWASFHLKKAGLLEQTRESTLRITEEGQKFLANDPPKITRAVLMQFEPFHTYISQLRRRTKDEGEASKDASDEETTPDERIEQADRELKASLSSELLDQMGKMDPFRFEQLVIDLLFAMGYGGSREEAARITKKTGDGGIDGIINEDRLGLDVIYVQAKRWQSNVGTTEIRNFIGSQAENHPNKGVFITTSDSSPSPAKWRSAVKPSECPSRNSSSRSSFIPPPARLAANRSPIGRISGRSSAFAVSIRRNRLFGRSSCAMVETVPSSVSKDSPMIRPPSEALPDFPEFEVPMREPWPLAMSWVDAVRRFEPYRIRYMTDFDSPARRLADKNPEPFVLD